MSAEAVKTLLHPFACGALEPPAMTARALFLGAPGTFRAPADFPVDVTCVQGFRPDFLALRRTGFAVSPVPEGDGYDVALVLAGRHRGQNETRVAEALERTVPGGLVVVAGGKEDGIGGLVKRVSGVVAVEDRLPKYHGAAFWLRRPADVAEAVAALRGGNERRPMDGRFVAAPGMFSHEAIDAGSRLLAQSLPADLSGAVADFCAGWGYLAAEVVRRCPSIAQIDLYEADFESLEAAKANLAGFAATRFFWHDLAAEPVAERYNAIVMNPPFHRGRAAEPGLGRDMIRAAAAALRPGGRLFMVANRELPYEAALDELFADWRETAREGGFKTFAAKR
ncbi:MAG: class I SAM-dependent methyltransferase [Rhizobiaceae bacterium]|nr:MAG: class I SAM-dependent methyltransferase [Rhizobiaceae bacterium]CAG0976712.1 Ribosomal RNA small subunit methyltransferase C [Rhizobiaceae bacterium]